MNSKMARFIFLLLTVVVAVWLLSPSINWYFFTPERDKELLKMSQDQLETATSEVKQKVINLKKLRKGSLSLGLDLQGGVNLTLQVNEADLRRQLLEKYDLDQAKVESVWAEELKGASERALEVLKNRMDTFGVAEPSIRKTFEGRISIELPGMDNPQLIRESLSKVGRLEFHIVDEATMAKLEQLGALSAGGLVASGTVLPEGYEMPMFGPSNTILKPQGNKVPEGSEWVSTWKNDQFGMPVLEGWLVLSKKVELDGTMVKTARADSDQFGRPKIDFELTSEGADIFGDVTAKNINKRLAIVLDGKVKSSPYIRGEIGGGTGEITGDFTVEETAFLVNVLKAGSLPVKMDIVQERVIGPTLGKDSISQSTKAALIGTLIVVVFMILYYRMSGIIAVSALIFNILYLIAMMGGVRATLTLSGIAGIALTIGMAVDANVIIFERIREELRRSKNYKHALENGFAHASTTIWDANLTTIIAALALFFFGSGTIKGFGLTLFFGIIANIFASLFISKLFFDWVMDTFKPKKISI